MASDTAAASVVEELCAQPSLSADHLVKLRDAARANGAEWKALQAKLNGLDAAGLDKGEKSVRKAAFLWILNKHDQAEAALKDVHGALGHFLHGEVELDRGISEKALSHLKSAAEQLTTSKEAGVEVAAALNQNGKPDEALKLLTKFEEKGQTGAGLSFQKGRALELLGRQEESMTSYEEALKVNPHHADANFRLAYYLDLRGDDERAVELYKSVTGQGQVFVSAMVNLALLLEDRGEVQEAIEYLKEALRADPTNQRAALYLRDSIESLDMYYDENERKEHERMESILRIPISDFELSVRSRNCLAKMNVKSLGDLVRKTEPELLSYKNFGETSLTEIKNLLESKGLRLGMFKDEDTKRARVTRLKIGGPDNPHAARPIADLELSVRSRKCMQRLNIESIGDLLDKSEAELLATKNFGQTSLNEIKAKLGEMGISLKPNE